MTIQFSRRGMAARPARALKARSSLVRRLFRAHDDPGKQRIRGWLRVSTMNSLRTPVSRPRTSLLCATEVSARRRSEHRRCSSTRQIGRMQQPEPSPAIPRANFL